MSEHVLPKRLYYGIWIALLVLTGVTAEVAKIDLGRYNTVVALAIATLKALLVVLFFMHVKYTSERLTRMVIVASLFWLLLLLVLSLSDYATRLGG